MNHQNHLKQVTLSVLLFVLGGNASLRADTSYANWPASSDWVALTNHISWCYQAIQQRNDAAGDVLSTNDFAPSFIYPYYDYVRFAQAIDELAPYFVCQTNASTSGYPDFGTYFSTPVNGNTPTDFPTWDTGSLHRYAFGSADWSTNAILHGWLTMTNHAIQTQVQNALTNLNWTSQTGGDVTNAVYRGALCGFGYRGNSAPSWTGEAVPAEEASWANAAETQIPGWDGGWGNWQDLNYYVCFNEWESVDGSQFYGGGAEADRVNSNPVLENCCTSVPVSVSLYETLNTETKELSMGDGWVTTVTVAMLPVENLGLQTSTRIVGGYFKANEIELNPIVYYPYDSWTYGGYKYEEAAVAQWLLKWQFTNMPPALASGTPAEDLDTDRDDIVDPGVDLNSVVSDTGTIIFRPEQDQPCVAIPLASTPSWCGGPAVHAYLSQGGTTNLPYQYLIPGVSDGDGPYQAYSLATCILESGVSADGTIKRVSVLRPRGNVVVFDFPWEGSTFSTLGYPVGINSNRTYVLQDKTSGDGSLKYDLVFGSGVTHQFNGGITNVLQVGGLSVPVATNGFPGCSVSFPASASDAKYNVAFTWTSGMVSHVTYSSKDNTKHVEVAVSGGAGLISALAKSGDVTDISKANASVSGSTITYGWGTVSRSQDAPAGQPRTVTMIETPAGAAAVTRTTKFNAGDRPYDLKAMATVAGNALVAETTLSYYDTQGRYDNGFLKCAKIRTITAPDLTSITYSYADDTGWLIQESTPIYAGFSRTIDYDYTTNDGDDAAPANVVERPRCVTVSLGGTPVAKTMYAYAGAAQAIIQQCSDATADWDAAGNQITTIATSVGGLTNGLPLSSVGPVVSSTWSYGIGGLSGGSFGSIGSLSVTESRNTGVTDSHVVNSFGYSVGGGTSKASSDGGTSYSIFSFVADSVDALGRPIHVTYSDGTTESASGYSVWGPGGVTRRDKSTATIGYADFGIANNISVDAPAQSTTVTTDPFGLQTVVTVTQGALINTTTDRQDLLGRPLYHADPLASCTWDYDDDNGVISISQGGLGPITVNTYADGSVSKIYGMGARQCVGYSLSVQNGLPALTVTALDANGGALSESATVACNALGQPVSAQQAGVSQPISIGYDSLAQPALVTDASGVSRRFNWDNHIGLEKFGVKADGTTDPLNPAGTDRMFHFGYAVDGTKETRTVASYQTTGSSAETPLLSVACAHDGSFATIGFAGQTNIVAVSDFSGPAAFTVDTASSDGTSTHEAYAPSGQILSMNVLDAQSGTNTQTTVNLEETSGGQIFRVWNSAKGYEDVSFDTAGRLVGDDASSSGGKNTSISYLSGTRLPSQVRGGGKTVTYEYHPNGLPSVVTASGAPTAHLAWDSQGRLHTLTLNQSSNQSSVTTWNRDTQTGRLTSKQVNSSNVESYTWKPNGQPDTVTRPSGTVAYQYNDGGDCIAVVDTPTNGSAETTTIANNRMGQVASRTIAGGVAEAYTRRVNGSLATVQVSGGLTPSYALDLPQDAGGRATGFTLTSGGQTRTATVAYNSASLVTNIADGAVAASYAYTPGKKAQSVNVRLNGSTCLVLSNGWNESLGVRTNMAVLMNGTPVASFAFQRGTGTNQISRITREDGSSREISYDGSGRLSGWKHKNAAGVADYDRSWAYGYDGANNLVSAGHDPSVAGGPPQMSPKCKQYATQNVRPNSTFDVDGCNLSTVRRWGSVDLVCMAATNAKVTVNGIPARQNGTRFVTSILLAQNSSAQVTSLTVCAVVSVSTNLEYFYTNTVALTLPAYPETITTALGSAVTADSVMEFLYDSLNKLRRVTDKAGTTAQRLQTLNDYYPDNRRARKTVTQWNGSSWQPYRTCQYVYNQWNLVREVVSNSTGVVTRDFTWGLDLAGLGDGQWGQTAGGIGGLLAITEVSGTSTNVFLPVCDHIGTVHALVAAMTNNVVLSTPVIVATYEYSPYGELIAQDGPYAGSCPFLFSSKYRDSETGLYYYGYRFYDAKAGKWLTADPSGEAGGLNLTEFVGGDPVNSVDNLGLAAEVEEDLETRGVEIGTPGGGLRLSFVEAEKEQEAFQREFADLIRGKAHFELYRIRKALEREGASIGPIPTFLSSPKTEEDIESQAGSLQKYTESVRTARFAVGRVAARIANPEAAAREEQAAESMLARAANIGKTTQNDLIENVLSGRIQYGELDSLGRPTGARATITRSMLGTGTRASQAITPPGFQGGGAGQARGHLVGAQLGGSGSEPRNLVTLLQIPVNTPEMRRFENQVASTVRNGEIVQYTVEPVYDGVNAVPRGITLIATGSGQFRMAVTVLNPIK